MKAGRLATIALAVFALAVLPVLLYVATYLVLFDPEGTLIKDSLMAGLGSSIIATAVVSLSSCSPRCVTSIGENEQLRSNPRAARPAVRANAGNDRLAKSAQNSPGGQPVPARRRVVPAGVRGVRPAARDPLKPKPEKAKPTTGAAGLYPWLRGQSAAAF